VDGASVSDLGGLAAALDADAGLTLSVTRGGETVEISLP
jgi:hypothetical protein